MAATEGATETKKKARKNAFKEWYPNEDPEKTNPEFFSLDAAALGAALFDIDRYATYVNTVKEQENFEMQQEAQARMLQERAAWNMLATSFEEELDNRVAKETTPGFGKAVKAMKDQLFVAFNVRSACILAWLPTEFILTGGKSSIVEMKLSMKAMLKTSSQLFSEFQGIDDFLLSFAEALPLVVTHIQETATISTGMKYDSETNLITILTNVLGGCGDWRPGIGKSSLLRVVYELFVHEWPEDLKIAAKGHQLWTDESAPKPFSNWKGVFWIMESGQFHYALKQATGTVVQGEGVYGRGDNHEDIWRSSDVLLLVDGAVPDGVSGQDM